MEETIPIENVDLQTSEVWKSDKIDKLATALSKAQSEIKGAEKKSVNPFFKSGYADLHTVIESSFPYFRSLEVSIFYWNSFFHWGSPYIKSYLF